MLEIYSINQTISENNGIIPFSGQSIKKGCNEELIGTNTIVLNKCGVYEITFNGEYIASDSGNIIIKLIKNGINTPNNVITIINANTTRTNTVTLSTLIQVRDNNSCKCCDYPTSLQFINSGVEIVGDSNLIVTKIC